MKQIYYVIQALIHGCGANIIKVVSLGLGLTMSILLFSRVVYEQSFVEYMDSKWRAFSSE